MTDLKVLSFPEYRKKIARKKFIDRIKAMFKRPKGFDKYRVVQWGYYTDTNRAWVEVQNLKTGKIKRCDVGFLRMGDDNHASRIISCFVSKLT